MTKPDKVIELEKQIRISRKRFSSKREREFRRKGRHGSPLWKAIDNYVALCGGTPSPLGRRPGLLSARHAIELAHVVVWARGVLHA